MHTAVHKLIDNPFDYGLILDWDKRFWQYVCKGGHPGSFSPCHDHHREVFLQRPPGYGSPGPKRRGPGDKVGNLAGFICERDQLDSLYQKKFLDLIQRIVIFRKGCVPSVKHPLDGRIDIGSVEERPSYIPISQGSNQLLIAVEH